MIQRLQGCQHVKGVDFGGDARSANQTLCVFGYLVWFQQQQHIQRGRTNFFDLRGHLGFKVHDAMVHVIDERSIVSTIAQIGSMR